MSGLVLESGMGLGVCVLRDGGGPSHDPDYPELPKGHERDVALTASSIRNKGSTAREFGGLGGGCSDTWL